MFSFTSGSSGYHRKAKKLFMICLDQCKEVLKNSTIRYSEEQIIKLRDFLYSLASIDYQLYQHQMIYEKSNPLHPRIH